MLATETDPLLAGLRQAHEEKHREAQEKWADFEAARSKALEKVKTPDGGITPGKIDAKTLRELDDLRKAYDVVAADAEDLQDRLLSRLGGKAAGIPEGAPGRITGLGAEFLKRMGAGPAGMKALDGTSGGTMVPPFFDPRIRGLPQRQTFVRSIIPVRPADGDKVWYLRQSVATHLAAPVAAGAEKPKSTYTVERIEETVRTIAHVTEALDRNLLSDFDELVNFLDGQLRLGVLLAEENQILNGNGTPPNLRGILNTAGIFAQARGADTNADAIHKAITAVRSAFQEPDAVVLHPANWETIRLAKNAEGNYQTAPVVESDPDRLWGKQVITSPVIASGTGLVGYFAGGCTVWDREQARITFTESGLGDTAGQEMFTRNQIRFRGEERIAFGVERPTAFCQVTGLN